MTRAIDHDQDMQSQTNWPELSEAGSEASKRATWGEDLRSEEEEYLAALGELRSAVTCGLRG